MEGSHIPSAFLPDPARYAHSQTFIRKMVLFCLALIYQYAVFRKTVRVEPESRSHAVNGALAAVSLCLWFGVAWADRAIAFLVPRASLAAIVLR